MPKCRVKQGLRRNDRDGVRRVVEVGVSRSRESDDLAHLYTNQVARGVSQTVLLKNGGPCRMYGTRFHDRYEPIRSSLRREQGALTLLLPRADRDETVLGRQKNLACQGYSRRRAV